MICHTDIMARHDLMTNHVNECTICFKETVLKTTYGRQQNQNNKTLHNSRDI